jgi:hypothetical protein
VAEGRGPTAGSLLVRTAACVLGGGGVLYLEQAIIDPNGAIRHHQQRTIRVCPSGCNGLARNATHRARDAARSWTRANGGVREAYLHIILPVPGKLCNRLVPLTVEQHHTWADSQWGLVCPASIPAARMSTQTYRH